MSVRLCPILHDSFSPASTFQFTGFSETQVQWSPSLEVATRETWDALKDDLVIIHGIPERGTFPAVIDHGQAFILLIHKNLQEEEGTTLRI